MPARRSRKREPKSIPLLRSVQPPQSVDQQREQQLRPIRHHDCRSRWCAIEGQECIAVQPVTQRGRRRALSFGVEVGSPGSRLHSDKLQVGRGVGRHRRRRARNRRIA
jgi:hypothetical protein